MHVIAESDYAFRCDQTLIFTICSLFCQNCLR